VTYVEEARRTLEAELPGQQDSLMDLYLLLVFTKGTETTAEDVHDAWAIWRSRTRPDHPAIIPFTDLHPDTARLDDEYVDAIHRAALAWAPSKGGM